MPDDERMDGAASGRDGLVAQLNALEEFVARSESQGDSLPPEAKEMILKLREIVQALDGLTASIEAERAANADAAERPNAT